MSYRQCICCGIVIETPFWLCQACEDAQGVTGVPYRKWPARLKIMVNQAKRDEYRAWRLGLVPFEDAGEVEAGPRGGLWESVGQEYDPEDADMASDLLRYAPYDDEAMNAEYRRSCGIAGRPIA